MRAAVTAVAAALLVQPCSAAAPAAPILCAIVERPTPGGNYSLLSVGADGSTRVLMDTGIPTSGPGGGLVSGVSAPSPATGTWWLSPPLGSQAAGVLRLDAVAHTVATVPVTPPPGCTGAYGLGAMAASDVPGEAVAVLAPTGSRAWAAVVEIAAGGGPVRVRFNLSLEAAGWDGIEPSMSAFDPSTRTLWVAATFVGSGLHVVAVPLDAPGTPPSSLSNVSVPFSMLAMAWLPARGGLVGVGAVSTDGAMGVMALDAAQGTWANLTMWPAGSLYLSGLGQVTVDPTGRFLYSVFANATAFPTIPVVDVVTGEEVSRIVLQPPAPGQAEPDMAIALGFLPAAVGRGGGGGGGAAGA